MYKMWNVLAKRSGSNTNTIADHPSICHAIWQASLKVVAKELKQILYSLAG